MRYVCGILPEIAPFARRAGSRALAMPSRIESNAPAPGNADDHLVPTTGVKAGAVQEENRRVSAWPFPDSEIIAVYDEPVRSVQSLPNPSVSSIRVPHGSDRNTNCKPSCGTL